MVIYEIPGVFYDGIGWEDFITNSDHPNFTIFTGDTTTVPELSDDGWVDVNINAPLTKALCERIIANYIGADVHIVETAVAISA